ncbi:hypothetical protein [Methanolobus psychrotolerans]|uniref:hypothetical protein n=1 Tax=Methanolobus psychrotolerans TaxID=1874706 RepID=UPI000B91769A|nr:hypothetical protein [Methanolobus psychrotolerans]
MILSKVLILLTIVILSVGIVAGNTSNEYSYYDEDIRDLNVSFEDVKKDSRIIATYGILPRFKTKEERSEWLDVLAETMESVVDDEIVQMEMIIQCESKAENVNCNDINYTTFMDLDKVAQANKIDISNNMLQYMTDDELNPTDYPTVVSLEYVFWGFGEIFINSNSEINKSTMNSIYNIFKQKGKENGIEDFPLVFVSVDIDCDNQLEQASVKGVDPQNVERYGVYMRPAQPGVLIGANKSTSQEPEYGTLGYAAIDGKILIEASSRSVNVLV